jgi:monoamine oxidase
MHVDLSAASFPTSYNSFTAAGYELDHLSILDWINSRVPGGHSSPLGQLLDVAYNIEYGAEIDVQSSLNLLYLLGFSGQGQFRIFGTSNEKYHVRGGNDQIVARLAQALDGQIETDAALAAIVRNSDGRYTLTFGSGPSTRSVTVEQVVLTLPFSKLRDVDYRKAGFVAPKTLAIKELELGANAKLQLQFSNRHWRGLGNNGDSYADTGYQDTWEVTRAQGGTAGILVNYTGGDTTRSQNGSTPVQLAQRFLGQIEPVLPGLGKKWNGKVAFDYWPTNPWSRGAYSYWAVGQYTRFAGSEYERSFNCHFCGEHTSTDSQGYLNGAVETGQRAAADVLADLKVKGFEK